MYQPNVVGDGIIKIPACPEIGLMFGSDSDLEPSLEALEFLLLAEDQKKARLVQITASIHRNTEKAIEYWREFSEKVNIWILAAGKANHLSGCGDAFLNYTLRRIDLPVIGVAMENADDVDSLAAILSIEQVPGHNMIFNRGLVGGAGVMKAALMAVNQKEFPERKLGSLRETYVRTARQAVDKARELRQEKLQKQEGVTA